MYDAVFLNPVLHDGNVRF